MKQPDNRYNESLAKCLSEGGVRDVGGLKPAPACLPHNPPVREHDVLVARASYPGKHGLEARATA